MNKKKLLYMIFLMITIVITGTLAYFTIVTDRSALVLVLGEQDEVLVTLNPFEIKGTLVSTTNYTSFETNEIENDYIQITAENVSSIPKKILFYYRINSIDDSLISTKLKYTITSSSTINGTYTEVLTGNFSTAAEGHDLTVFEFDVPANTTIFYRVFTYLDGNQNTTSMSGSLINAEFRAEMEHIITPELDEGMIPIIYMNNEMLTVSLESELGKYWYDYDKHMWANVALVTEESRSKYMGTNEVKIEMEDLLGLFVWIPRYEYRHNNLGTNYAGGTQESPGAIAINFIPSYITTPTSSAYKIHPAFTFGDTELNGFWMGKCPTGISISSGNPLITCNFPGGESDILVGAIADLSTQFEMSLKFNGGELNNGQVTFDGSNYYGTTSNFDSHMAKNSEWGAVTYLGQSIYGACQTESKCYLGNYPMSSLYVDILTGEGIPEEESEYATIATLSGVMDLLGVQIMSSGENLSDVNILEERSMSVLQYDSNFIYTGNNSGTYDKNIYREVRNSGFYGYIGDVYYDTEGYKQLPPSKYYDRYTSNNINTACNGGICYGHALSETAGWYGNNNNFVTPSSPWMSRIVNDEGMPENLEKVEDINLGRLFFDIDNNDGGSISVDSLEKEDFSEKLSMFRTVIVNTKKSNNNSQSQLASGATMLINKANDASVTTYSSGNTGEMYTFSQPATTQVGATTDYRYIGSSPNNYITFNNETWRIIGVFDGKIKIIKDTSIGNMYWDYKKGIGSATMYYGSNDWVDSQLMYMLNPNDIAANVALKTGYTYDGTYVYDANTKTIYQKGCIPASTTGTSYSCTANTWSLNEIALSQVDDVTYYLGGGEYNSTTHYGTTLEMYTWERGDAKYNTVRSTNWTGKVGLMYPSDFGYTFAYGVNNTCYNDVYNCNSSTPSSSWLYNSSVNQWTLSPTSSSVSFVFYFLSSGRINSTDASNTYGVRPVVYLKSNVNLTGTGTSGDPYVIG